MRFLVPSAALALLLGLHLLSTGFTAQPRPTSFGGSQWRGAPGRNARLECRPINLRATFTVFKVVCNDCDGFWLERNGQLLQEFPNPQAAIGYVLSPGEYTACPNLLPGKPFASIKVHIN
jgi:hypothetical protein